MGFLEGLGAAGAAFINAWAFFLNPEFVAWMLGGLVLGLLLGIIPGIGAMVGVAIFLPFVFYLTPTQALPFIMGVFSVPCLAGSVTTILLGVPGVVANMATLQDGFPMAKKGEAGRALGAAVTASGMGSIYTAAFAILMVALIIPLVIMITSAEMVFLILLGLTMIAVLSRGSMLKGLISGFLGILVGLIGWHVITGVSRFTFDNLFLYDGLSIIPVGLGLFALPEMVNLIVRGGSIAQQAAEIKGMKQVWRGVKDVFHHWKLNLGCSLLGYTIGVLPGVGGSVASWVSYAQAKQFSKHPELFGTGIVEGVIAPESGNDAKEGGALLTTLALGIPGSSSLVLLLAALVMLGFAPGPQMLTEHLDLSLALVLVIAVASVIGAVICLTAAPYLAKVAYIPGRILVPLVLAIVFIGAFAYHQLFPDLIVLAVFGALGIFMQRFGYNRAALMLGYILGNLFEKYLFISLQAFGDLFFLRPGSLGLIVVIILFLSFDPLRGWWLRRRSRRGASKV